jgi:hypothetical protein
MTVRQKRAVAASLLFLGWSLLAVSLPVAPLAYLAFEERMEAESVPSAGRPSLWDGGEGAFVLAALAGSAAGVICLLSGSAWQRRAVEPRPFVPDPLRHLGAR